MTLRDCEPKQLRPILHAAFSLCLSLGFFFGCKEPNSGTSGRDKGSPPVERSGATAPLTPLDSNTTGSKRANDVTSQNPASAERKPTGSKIGCGQASFYGSEFAGQPTANGEIFDPSKLTAAHRSLEFGTKVRVLRQGQSAEKESDGVVVKINDRGPFVAGRIIDLSTAAFQKLASVSMGVASVCIFSVND